MGVPELPDLHDAVLNDLRVEWEAGTAEIRLVAVDDAAGHAVVLAAAGVRQVEVERRYPWGPSESVNSTSFESVEASDEVTLNIEMQSGDRIRVTATGWDVYTEA